MEAAEGLWNLERGQLEKGQLRSLRSARDVPGPDTSLSHVLRPCWQE